MSELLAECAASLTDPFTRAEIIGWFASRYPDIRETTVSTHIAGLTAGDAGSRASSQFANREPVLERVGRGVYRRARDDDGMPPPDAPNVPSAPLTSANPEAPQLTDVVLVGCVKSKRTTAAPARDLYTGALFTRRRRFAEGLGVPWFVVSSRWGLVAPNEVIAPYDQHLGDMPASYRRAWAALVVAQLQLRMTLRHTTIEVHAGDHYVNALRPELERAGATLVDPVDAHSMGETLAWYDRHGPTRDAAPAEPDVEALVRSLEDGTAGLTPAELRREAGTALAVPGLYSWWVDDAGANELSQALGHEISPGLIYAGQAGATHHRSGKPSANTLAGRLVGMHLGGRALMSTFRLTLGSILWPTWDGTPDEASLTTWMEAHLRVVPLPVMDRDTLDAVESAVLGQLDPPLNLAKRPVTPVRAKLRRLRRRYGRTS